MNLRFLLKKKRREGNAVSLHKLLLRTEASFLFFDDPFLSTSQPLPWKEGGLALPATLLESCCEAQFF